MVLSRRTSPIAAAISTESTAQPLLDDANASAKYQPHAENSGSGRLLLSWAELPEWMRDNQFIHTGYRAPANSFKRCFASLLYMHNETGNIMSHLLGALGFTVLCFTVTQGLLREFSTVDWHDITTLYIFLVGAVLCMGTSAFYHTVTCHSPGVQRTYNRCDYLGIVFLIVGSCVPVFCYLFYCHPKLKMFYLLLIFSLGSLTAYMVVAPKFGTSAYRPLRAATFVALGLSGILPAIHSCWLFGWEYTRDALQAPYMLTMGGTYIAGAVIYGARFPERVWPGRFDYWLHSHQIFHVFVVVAAVAHFLGVSRALRWTHTTGLELCRLQS
ncbi:hypothetical protein GGI07_000806 [Coemansia sp. Benny D115]|nr:hypothetical protein GGI07_000806 [Coemansia sp. Benny D115]